MKSRKHTCVNYNKNYNLFEVVVFYDLQEILRTGLKNWGNVVEGM